MCESVVAMTTGALKEGRVAPSALPINTCDGQSVCVCEAGSLASRLQGHGSLGAMHARRVHTICA